MLVNIVSLQKWLLRCRLDISESVDDRYSDHLTLLLYHRYLLVVSSIRLWTGSFVRFIRPNTESAWQRKIYKNGMCNLCCSLSYGEIANLTDTKHRQIPDWCRIWAEWNKWNDWSSDHKKRVFATPTITFDCILCLWPTNSLSIPLTGRKNWSYWCTPTWGRFAPASNHGHGTYLDRFRPRSNPWSHLFGRFRNIRRSHVDERKRYSQFGLVLLRQARRGWRESDFRT